MIFDKTVSSLQKNGFEVECFDTAEQASAYLSNTLSGETVGFGGSVTLREMNLYAPLSQNNTVHSHWENPNALDHFSSYTTFITSANAVSETGELVNIDGQGNRIAAAFYGAPKVFFVVGQNKITPDLPSAIARAREIAAPRNAQRLQRATPCAVDGICHDCNSPARICRGMAIHMRPMLSQTCTVVLVGEDMGF